MKPGILPPPPPPCELRRVSPSRFYALQECPLREIWAVSRRPALLPSSPRARLGSVAHKLLELAGKGLIVSCPPNNMEQEWDKLVASTNELLISSWIDSRFVPLQDHVGDVEVLKLRACRRAVAVASERRVITTDMDFQGSSPFEVWLESTDGTVGGLIDEVRETDQGILIRDYKTGFVHDYDEQGLPRLKETYQAQLRLYAALYAQKTGKWPDCLAIVPLGGEEIAVTFTAPECEHLLQQATDLLHEVNALVKQHFEEECELSRLQTLIALAKPSVSGCRFCVYRPVCPAYSRERTADPDQAWPLDKAGQLVELKKLGNGMFSLLLQDSNDLDPVTVRGISSDPQMHPALDTIQKGSHLAAFNLRKIGTRTFTATQSTIFYRDSVLESE